MEVQQLVVTLIRFCHVHCNSCLDFRKTNNLAITKYAIHILYQTTIFSIVLTLVCLVSICWMTLSWLLAF